jgi:hypothetical protein
VRRRYLAVVPGLFPAAPRRSLELAKAGNAATPPQHEKNNSEGAQRGGFIPRGDIPGRQLRGGCTTADACLNRSYATCACGTKPRREPPAALEGANRNIF